MKTTASIEISFNRSFPSGMTSFSAFIGQYLRTFRTDRFGSDANRAAREFFAQEWRKEFPKDSSVPAFVVVR